MADDSDYDIKIGLDDSNFMKEFKALQTKIKSFKFPTLKVPKPQLQANIQAKVAGSGGGARGSARSDDLSTQRQERMLNAIQVFEKRNISAFRNSKAASDQFANSINNMRNSVKQATKTSELVKLQNRFNLLKVDIQQTAKALRTADREMLSMKNTAAGLNQSLKNLFRSYASVFAVLEASRHIFQAGRDMDSLRATMLAASGDAKESAENFSFVTAEAQRLGINLIAAGKGYAKIGTSAKAAGFDAKATQEIFLAAAEASRTFGLNADRTNLVFLAFSQILSKGKVSQEELRRQMGEQLPGVMNVAAKAMNVTTGELEQLIKTGISAADFMPKFAKEMRKFVRENNAMEAATHKVEASIQRFTNVITILADTMFKAGLASTIKGVFDGVADLVKVVIGAFMALQFVFESITSALDRLSMAFFGVENNINIVSFAVKLLAAIMISRLTKGFTLVAVSATSATASVMRFTGALLAAKAAAKSLLRVGGIGLAIEAGAFLVDKAISAGASKAPGGGNTNTTNNNTFNNQFDGATSQSAEATVDILSAQLSGGPNGGGFG